MNKHAAQMNKLHLALLLLALAAGCLAADDREADAQTAGSQTAPPKSLSFLQFKVAFGRRYRSLLEELGRQRVFLAKSVRAFVSRVWFQRGRRSYYLAVNEMSDRTPAELERGQPPLEQLRAEELKLTAKLMHRSQVDALDELAADAPLAPAPLDQPLDQPQVQVQLMQNGTDQVHADLRQSNCLNAPRSQRNCASCYMFPVVAAYEWQYCQDTGERVAFSEQYLLDCGARAGLKGCAGGRASEAVAFVANFGLALRRHYPYEGAQRLCPYERGLAAAQMGSVRADAIQLQPILSAYFAHHLQRRPIIVYLAVQDRFHEYGGGVDDGKGCQPHRNHMVLIVGHGRQDGRDYWLMRNSYGVKYGEAGHYKIDKRANCTAFLGHGYILRGSFHAQPEANRNGQHQLGQLRSQQRHQLQTSLAASKQSQSSNSELPQVRVLSGTSQQAELPCLVDQTNCGEVYYIAWTRQASPSAAWSRVYLYTGANDSAPHKPAGELLHRAHFVMPERWDREGDEWAGQQPPTARLLIEEPRPADDGLYKCDVTYVKGKCPSISLVRLQVMQLPEKALIVRPDEESDNLDGRTVGPYSEGQQLRLLCLVRGGRPAPSALHWRKIDQSGRTVNLAGGPMLTRAGPQPQTELQLNHTLSSADLGAKFECHVEHQALERPPAVVVPPSSSGAEPSSAAQDALLDLHPAAPSQQQAANLKSIDSHVHLDLNVGVASLDLLMNKLGGERANTNASGQPLQEGDLVELECVAYNSRPPANISWFNGHEPIEPLDPFGPSTTASPAGPRRHKRLLQRNQVHPNQDGHTYNTHSFLSIKLSRHEHRAQISCQALNGQVMRQPLSKSIELQVQHAPIVLMEPAAGLVLNEPASDTAQDVIQAQIYCIYTANPSQLLANSTRWFKDGQLLATAAESRYAESITNTGYPVLTISQVQRRDAGLYECQLSNSVGASEHLPASENCRLEVNFRPSTQLRLYKPALTWSAGQPIQPADLSEVDLTQELVAAGGAYVLVCDVLEAQPTKIVRFHWFQRRPLPAGQAARRLLAGRPATVARSGPLQPLAEQQSSQLLLASLPANFTPTAYACAASNSLGAGEPSNQIELRLSYQPGPSHVRVVKDAALRKKILMSGKPAHPPQTGSLTAGAAEQDLGELDDSPLVAGRELLLQCITPDLGQPRANIWLWFKDGHPIESHQPLENQPATNGSGIAPLGSKETNESASEDNDAILNSNNNNDPRLPNELISDSNDNPITSSSQELSATSYIASSTFDNRKQNGPGRLQRHNQRLSPRQDIRLLGSGSYLYIPSIQLVHKGNYSCVAVNRLGSGHQQSPASGGQQALRDSFQLNVVLAPSFVQPLASRTYWPEVSAGSSSNDGRQLELVCHVQCEPICQIEWLRNNEPLDLRRQSESLSSNYVAYQMKQSIMDESLEANMFKSVESRLVFRFQESQRSGESLSRDKILERRAVLSGANYTCQSSPNFVGPPVRSTTKFIVQYPPENVLINTPSDKLNLVDGSNGPRLSCEASAEPQVQFRWFMVPTKDNNNNDFSRNGSNSLFGGRSSGEQSSKIRSSGLGSERDTINQVTSRALDTFGGGANDALTVANQEHLIELTGAVTEQLTGAASTSVSTLDLSGISLGRKQTGLYFCEASNRLGIARQSVYLNVLYKPTCATLHLHSLDVTIAPSWDDLRKEIASNQVDDGNQIARTKPFRATVNDEYSIVRETSEDFIDLRKILVLSPLLNRYPLSDGSETNEELSFKGSIFQTIMNDKRIESENESHRVPATKQFKEIRDKSALMQSDDQRDNRGAENALINVDNQTAGRQNQIGDSWDKFNVLLLKFLNNYMRQVKNYEERMMEALNIDRTNRELRNRRQNARSPGVNQDEAFVRPKNIQSPLLGGTKNLLTFACMPKDANPMSNLTFDWHFGLTNLPETESESPIDGVSSTSVESQNYKPMLIYANENYTIQVMLVRRLDTRSSLNPFQMSLLTLNVIIEQPDTGLDSQESNTLDNINKTGPLRMPVLRNRYQSVYHGSRASQFGHEFESATKPHNLEMNDQNWQEQIGNLLKCTITNQIGTSDACHVRVNIAERLRSQSSSSEFAKWRMPSLAHKSLLIISILIGCGTIVFAAATLLAGPFIRGILLKQEESVTGSGVENNTGQSTSSQKSSVLGLLGNGDSSTQGSSDDDSSGRLHHHHHHLHHANNLRNVDDRALDRSMRLKDVPASNGYLGQNKLTSEPSANYDQPRGISESRLVYHNGNFNEGSIDVLGDSSLNSYDYTIGLANARLANVVGPSSGSKASTSSAGSRLMANLGLKSLSKFKVDRISDLANFSVKNLHSKNVSNTETNTTGLSVSVLDNELSMKLATTGAQSPAFLGESATLRSHKRYLPQQQIQRPDTSYYLFDQNGLYSDTDSHMVQLNSHRLINTASSIMPTYSNMGSNAMDDFLKQRGIEFSPSHLDDGSSFFRSQSIRGPNPFDQQATYLSTVNDCNQLQRKDQMPQIKPRLQQQTSTMYRSHAQERYKPPVTARTSHRHQLGVRSGITQGYAPIDNRFSMPTYNHLLPMSTYVDTIDSHLNRLAANASITHYQDQTRVHNMAYGNGVDMRAGMHNTDDNQLGLVHKSSEHIYDTNAYATPEQTPLRGQNNINNSNSTNQAQLSTNSERPPVSQLIQTFNSKIPE